METYIYNHHEVFVDYVREREHEHDNKKILKVSIKMVDQNNYKEFQNTFPITLFSSKVGDVKKMISRFFSAIPNYSIYIMKEPASLTLFFRVSLEGIVMKEIEIQLPCTRVLTEVEQLRLEVSRLKECAVAELAVKMTEIQEWKKRVEESLKHAAKMEQFFLNMHTKLHSACDNYVFADPVTINLNTTEGGRRVGINVDRLSLQSIVYELTPFFNLKRLEYTGIDSLCIRNEFVEELVLIKCKTLLYLEGIETMPNLKTISFDECPMLNPSHLFEIEYQITVIYARACPTLVGFKDELEARGIAYKPFV